MVAASMEQLTATGTPTATFSVSGALPVGVSFNSSTGVLSGTPDPGTADGYPITFTAHNGIGSDATQSFMLTVANPSSSSVEYYFSDPLGTARVVTNASGTVCYDADLYPYGGERAYTNTCDVDFKFTGKERDSESGLDNFGARYDSSQYGRFMTPDPIFFQASMLTDPQRFNLYAYVRN